MISIFASIISLFSVVALAAPEDVNIVYQVNFTEPEIEHHQQNIKRVVEVASQCLDDTYEEHLEFFERHGVSKFYGDRRAQHQTREGLVRELQRFGKPASLVNQLEPISCIGLTLRCLGRGFAAVGSQSTWDKIMDHLLIDDKVYGTDLQIMLQMLGWELHYWNPDPSSNERWDAQDKELTPLAPGRTWMPVWGGHSYRYATTMNRGVYYESYVDVVDSLVGFGSKQPVWFAEVPFFVGIAHAGYHVFPGRDGEVIEAHSTRQLNSIDNLEFSQFNSLATGGGPRWTRTEKYRSGLIAIPPQSR